MVARGNDSCNYSAMAHRRLPDDDAMLALLEAGDTYTEIAAATGATVGAVKSAARRLRDAGRVEARRRGRRPRVAAEVQP